MTEEELIQKFSDIFQNTFPTSQIDRYEKFSSPENMIGIHLRNGSYLVFKYSEKVWKLIGESDYIL